MANALPPVSGVRHQVGVLVLERDFQLFLCVEDIPAQTNRLCPEISHARRNAQPFPNQRGPVTNGKGLTKSIEEPFSMLDQMWMHGRDGTSAFFSLALRNSTDNLSSL